MAAPNERLLHASLSDPVSELIEIFFSKNVTHLPVVDNERFLGLISIGDLISPYLAK